MGICLEEETKMLDFDWNQMRTNIPAPPRITAGHIKVATATLPSKNQRRLDRYVRMVITNTFLIIGSSLLVSFILHTFATSLSYKVQLSKLACSAQLERNSRLQMSLDNLVTNQHTARQFGLSEFSTPERISAGGHE
jgi:hypothetical protein